MSQMNAAKDDNSVTQRGKIEEKKRRAKSERQSAAFRATAAKKRRTIMRVKDGIYRKEWRRGKERFFCQQIVNE